MMIKIKRKDLNNIIESIASSMFEESDLFLYEDMADFEDVKPISSPAIQNEPQMMEKEPAVIDPKSDIQVSNQNLPITDSSWTPGNNTELGIAMRQMSEQVPEGQLEWFYTKLRRLVDKTLDNEDEARMQPRLG